RRSGLRLLFLLRLRLLLFLGGLFLCRLLGLHFRLIHSLAPALRFLARILIERIECAAVAHSANFLLGRLRHLVGRELHLRFLGILGKVGLLVVGVLLGG